MSVQRALQAASAEDVHALCARLLAFNRKASGNSFDELPLQLANRHLRRLAQHPCAVG